MKKIFKLTLKITVLLVLLVFGVLITIPLLFKEEIMEKLKLTINQEVNALVDFQDIDLSLIKDFPRLTLEVKELSVINNKPFKGDTLLYARRIFLGLSLKTLFKKDEEPYKIKQILLSDAKIKVLVNKEGVTNYDIAAVADSEDDIKNKSSSSSTNQKYKAGENKTIEDSPFKIGLEKYALERIDIYYKDESIGLETVLNNLNHYGSGDFTSEVFNLSTKTTSEISLNFGGIKYISNNQIDLKAIIGIDMSQNKYTFLENEFSLNRLKLNFDGFIKILEDAQEYNLKFDTPSTSFLSFLEMIPQKYTKSLEGVKTEGSFSIKGSVKGRLDKNRIPDFKISLLAKNGKFQYPDLPKSLDDIQIETHILSTTGNMDDIKINIPRFGFRIGKDKFQAKANISNPIKNLAVQSIFKGTIDLSKIKDLYPLPKDNSLSGSLTVDISADFDMDMIEKNAYEKSNINGLFSLSNFKYISKDFPNPIDIKKANIAFTPNQIQLKEFNAISGNSDFKINGNLGNLLGFIFNEGDIKGDFMLKSNHFNLGDFVNMTDNSSSNNGDSDKDGATKNDEEGVISNTSQIPKFLDCTFKANIKTLIYDDLTLENMNGVVILKNQVVYLKDINFGMFQGDVTLNGLADTRKDKMYFKTNLDIKKLDLSTSFSHIEMLKKVAPISNALKGKFNSIIKFEGLLNNDYTPNNNSLTGDVSLKLDEAKFTPEKSEFLTSLNQNIGFIDLKKSVINDIDLDMSVKDGKVNVKPFKYRADNLDGTIGGVYGFDNKINFTIDLNLPIEYLGEEVNNLVKQINDPEIKNTKVPVGIGLTGNVSKPKIKINMNSAVKIVKNKLINYTKKRAKNEIKNELKKQLSGFLQDASNDKKEENKKDGKEDSKENKAEDLLDLLFR